MSVGVSRGITLVEVAVAVFILGVGVVTAAWALAQARHLQTASQGEQVGRILVENEIETLRALPFWKASEGSGQPVGNLLSAVFPHTAAARNTPTSFYVCLPGMGAPVGSFVSLRVTGLHTLRTVAQFAVATGNGWRTLGCDELQDFAAGSSWAPPSTTLLISVTASIATADGPVVKFERQAVIVARGGSSRPIIRDLAFLECGSWP